MQVGERFVYEHICDGLKVEIQCCACHNPLTTPSRPRGPICANPKCDFVICKICHNTHNKTQDEVRGKKRKCLMCHKKTVHH